MFPKQDGLGWTSTISEKVQDDTRTLVYSGPIDMSSGAFGPTVILALAAQPESVKGNEYTIVASAVELVLTGLIGPDGSAVNSTIPTNTTLTNITQVTNSSTAIAHGLFEYTRSPLAVNAATARLSNNSETSLTRLGFALASAANQSTFSVNAVATSGNVIYVGGNFSAPGNYSNVLSIDSTTNQTASLPNQGLDGAVHAINTIGNNVFFGGDFRATATGGVPLLHLARYDTGSKSWSSLDGGVDGPVTDLTTSASQLVITGNFSHVIAADGKTTPTGGYAVWDTSSSSWSTSGILFGNVTTAAANGGITYMAGKVYGRSNNPANGVAMLSTEDGAASISTLSSATLGSSVPNPSPSSAARKRSHKSTFTRSWLSRFTDAFTERTILPRAPAPSIAAQPVTAPAVLAGAFWKNGSQSVTIFGGNFSSDSGSVAFYTDSLHGPSSPVTGVVRALEVIDDRLYVGGTGVSVSGGTSNLAVYDLAQNSWIAGGIPALNPSSGSSVSINTIQQRLNSKTVVIGGNFATAGSLNCAALCLWDTSSNQWNAPGQGLSSGEVRAIDFAGDNYNSLIAAGSFVLPTGAAVYVATYSFDNNSWTALDGLPGPALALAVDDRNLSNIYAAGYSTSDNSAYLQQWNGQQWTAQNSSLLPRSIIQQLAFVPLAKEHTAEGSMETDRMLMVSGDLYLKSTGNVTSALYDGKNWYPYLVASASTGGLASGSQLFWSESTFDFRIRHYLARGLVVLVAIAIATGLILLLILLFFLVAYCTRRHERKTTPRETFAKEGSPMSSTHQTVLNNVQAALEQSLVGDGAAGLGAGAGATAAAAAAAERDRNRRSDQSSYADLGAYQSDREQEEEEGSDEEGRETTMRYDFDGPELQPGEMAMRAGQRIVILDDTQSDEWFYARDPISGREGVVPATYGECCLPY